MSDFEMKNSQPSYYAEMWNKLVKGNPVLLFIEPPLVTDLPEAERRPVALFCLEAALLQLKNGRHFVFIHPAEST